MTHKHGCHTATPALADGWEGRLPCLAQAPLALCESGLRGENVQQEVVSGYWRPRAPDRKEDLPARWGRGPKCCLALVRDLLVRRDGGGASTAVPRRRPTPTPWRSRPEVGEHKMLACDDVEESRELEVDRQVELERCLPTSAHDHNASFDSECHKLFI